MCVSVSYMYSCACMYLATMDAKDGIKTSEIGVIDFVNFQVHFGNQTVIL